jgi:hypothetical protein
MWKFLNPLSIVILAIGLGLSAPARAEIVYTFASSEGDFVYVSPSYFDYGELSLGQLYSYSFPAQEEINGVAFDGAQGLYSTVYLGQDDCINTDSCFKANFGPDGFYALGTYHDQDTGATLVVSTGVPRGFHLGDDDPRLRGARRGVARPIRACLRPADLIAAPPSSVGERPVASRG